MREPGRTLVGLSLVPETTAWPTFAELVRAADDGGLDLIGIQDHPYQWRFLETFALIATLLARTSRITIFPDVANLPLRPPSVLAKTASTLDRLSRGRFALGLGAGAFWEGIEAMGGPRRSAGESVDALEEGIEVIRLMWSGGRGLRYDGEHYRLRGVHAGEPPPHGVEIWVGAYRPRMLRLVGRKADGWIPSLGRSTPEKLRAAQEAVDAAAEAAGRDPSTIRRLLNVGGAITAPGAGDTRGGATSPGALASDLAGPPEYWRDVLGRLREVGFEAFVFWPAEATVEQVERLAGEVAPLVRAAS